jgi:hypothetical protein
MMRLRTLGLLLYTALAAGLAGCAAGPKAHSPAGLSLAGHWKLDHGASTDPQQVIARMREEADKIISRYNDRMGTAPPVRARPGGGGSAGATQPADDAQVLGADEQGLPGAARGGTRPDPLRRSPMMHVLRAALDRGDFLTVRQSEDEFVLDYGTSVRSFTPGQHSVVSAEGGVADQISGWKGHEYVITDKAQLGPNVVEHYALSGDGKQLVETLRIGPAELKAVQLTRVYNRTDEVAPRALPTTD